MGKVQSIIRRANAKISPKKLFYAPSWVVLGVNNICNLHCKMCDVGTQNVNSNFATNLVGSHPINMPLELIQTIFDQVYKYYPKTRIGYGFTEPLVYPHLISSLNYAQEYGLDTSITTNGLTLASKAEELVDAGLKSVFISLDGPEDIHNYIRGHKSSFQRALKGIEAIIEKGNGPEISIFCVITEWNIGRLKEFADYFRNYPLKQLGFMHTNFTTQAMADDHNLVYGMTYPATESNTDELNLEAMDLDLLWEEIKSIESDEYPFPITFSPRTIKKDELTNFYQYPERLIGKRCHDAFNNLMIKSDGSVIPAHGRCYNLSIGNIYEAELSSIWNSSIAGNFRKTLNDAGGLLPACSRCCSAFSS